MKATGVLQNALLVIVRLLIVQYIFPAEILPCRDFSEEHI